MTGASSSPQRIAITGATGLVGSALVHVLAARGHIVQRIVRSRPDHSRGDIGWDPAHRSLDSNALEGVDAVVHLSGENLAQRWSDEVKQRLRSSRVDSTHFLAESLAKLTRRPRALLTASAIGIYGDRGATELDEGSPAGEDFLACLARDWEAAAEPAARAAIRVSNTRFGVILSTEGGALRKLLTPFKLGAGGRIGDGKQWMSWVGIDDVVGAIQHVLADDRLAGAVNITSPEPVTNARFSEILGQVLHRPAVMHVPAVALKLAFGEMAEATLLASVRAQPRRLLESGYRFQHAALASALRAALGRAS